VPVKKTGMAAILVEDDASGWYESGVARDMAISRNTFIQCGEAVIQIVPHAPQPEGNVHGNITITGNTFDLGNGTAIRTRHTGNVKAEKNAFIKDGKNIPAEKAADIRQGASPFTGAVKRAPSRKRCPSAAG
jgi:hypothetical protein